MICPKCGAENPAGSTECVHCGIIFAKWRPPESKPASSLPPQQTYEQPAYAPRSAESVRRTGGEAIIYLGLIALLILIAWWILKPSVHSIVEGSFVNKANHFAIKAPDDWVMLNKNNYRKVIEEHGDRFPPMLRDSFSSNDIGVGFIKLGGSRKFAPSVNVVIVKNKLPKFSNANKNRAAKLIAYGMESVFNNYTQDSVDVVKVDKLNALKIVSSTSMDLLVPSPRYARKQTSWGVSREKEMVDRGFTETMNLRIIQYFVPGKKMGYVISCTSTSRGYADLKPVFADVVDSFRVLVRPPRFSASVRCGILGAFLVMGIGLVKRFMTALGGGERT